MARCRVDPTIERVTMEGFSFPLGVYPIEAMKPKAGYTVEFEPADGDDSSGDWEEWPDRYVYDIVIGADRIEPLCRSLLGLLPGRVYPILDVLGQDAYREIDPYISYDLIGMDRFTDMLRRYRGLFFEDGLCGFGAMADEPFLYVFVDEHKIITVRAEADQKERVERVLAAFDLEPAEQPAGADSAPHEHRGVLEAPDDRPDLLTAEEIVEQLRDEWNLTLNVDPEGNTDDEGNDLGITGWRCLVRCIGEEEERARYADAVITAGSLRRAEELALDAADELRPKDVEEWAESLVVSSDRVTPERLTELLGAKIPEGVLAEEGIKSRAWLE
ncbi:MAG: hypothetical protein ACKVU4_09080 [Phycisphaerales bacterium]